MYEKFKGIFPALLTPFHDDGSINFDALETLVERLISQGVKGFYVDGSTGEAFLLSTEERKALIKAVAAFTKGRVTLIAQIGSVCLGDAISLAQCARDAGYDAISSVPPFYYKFSFDEIKRYYYAIVEAVDLPMLIYNVPLYTGVSFSAEQISEFLRDDRFIGVKHTSSDFFALRQFRTAFPDKVMLNGYDEMLLAGLSLGANGAIGSTYNFMPEKFIRIYNCFNEGKLEEAARLQEEADKIIAALCRVGVMQSEKAILTKLGIPMGALRAPFIDITPEQKEKLFTEVLPLL
ncbi:MAG: N-acetylneuraminate lyase [Clostridia bacterium]|nr:N-acetylneuraminate lyase [Clostridia bacterium]